MSCEDRAEDGVNDEAECPERSLKSEREVRFDNKRVGEQGKEGACIGQCKEPVRDASAGRGEGGAVGYGGGGKVVAAGGWGGGRNVAGKIVCAARTTTAAPSVTR